jgi:hypothetical protein
MWLGGLVPAHTGIRRQLATQYMIEASAHPPRSETILAGHRWVPPAGFEPALTAPEAVGP